MTNPENDRTVYLRLTRAEALVLFDWLARVDAAKNLPIEDPAEERVLWRLEGQLESTLVEPLGPKYKDAVEAARKEVRGSPAIVGRGRGTQLGGGLVRAIQAAGGLVTWDEQLLSRLVAPASSAGPTQVSAPGIRLYTSEYVTLSGDLAWLPPSTGFVLLKGDLPWIRA